MDEGTWTSDGQSDSLSFLAQGGAQALEDVSHDTAPRFLETVILPCSLLKPRTHIYFMASRRILRVRTR